MAEEHAKMSAIADKRNQLSKNMQDAQKLENTANYNLIRADILYEEYQHRVKEGTATPEQLKAKENARILAIEELRMAHAEHNAAARTFYNEVPKMSEEMNSLAKQRSETSKLFWQSKEIPGGPNRAAITKSLRRLSRLMNQQRNILGVAAAATVAATSAAIGSPAELPTETAEFSPEKSEPEIDTANEKTAELE